MMDRSGAATAFGDIGRFLPLHNRELNRRLGQQDAVFSRQEAISHHRQPDDSQVAHQAGGAFFSPTASAASAAFTGQRQHGIIGADAFSVNSLAASSPTFIKCEQTDERQAELSRLTYALGQAGDGRPCQEVKLEYQASSGYPALDSHHSLHHLHVAPLADPSTSQLVHSKSLVNQAVLHGAAGQQVPLANFHGLGGVGVAVSRRVPPPHAYHKLNSTNKQANSATAATAHHTPTLSPHTNNIIFSTSASSSDPLPPSFLSSASTRRALSSHHLNPTSSGASAPLLDHHNHHLTMAAPFDPQADELARMQELSNNWEPEATGPLVSDRLPSSALTQEYANADPAYRVKTESLPQKYEQYRRCRGDGHCGWRAIAFCYFEALLRIGDKQKFQFEEARLKSLQNMLKDIGLSEHVYEDFVDDTVDLLREMSTTNDDGVALLRAFNDFSRSQSVITFLKLLTSASIQKNPDQWQPFVEIPIADYCKNRIDPAVAEIEHVGLSALVELLTKPAGIAVEVLYLDRSPGNDVTTYRFDPVDQNGMTLQNSPTFRLLYRPGHYDILYKREDLPMPAPSQSRATPLNLVVGLSATPGPYVQKLPFPVSSFEIPGMEFFSEATPVSHSEWSPPIMHQYEYTPSLAHRPSVSSHVQSVAVSAPHYQSLPPPPDSIHHDFYGQNGVPVGGHQPSTPISPVSAMTDSISSFGNPMDTKEPFRPSKYELERGYLAMPPNHGFCQTTIFKNSHYNTAHFNNPEFTPEQWRPEDEYRNSTRKRSSGH